MNIEEIKKVLAQTELVPLDSDKTYVCVYDINRVPTRTIHEMGRALHDKHNVTVLCIA